MRPEGSVNAVVWDYDGTLVDTRAKNYAITRAIVERVTGGSADRFAILRSVDSYAQAASEMVNWRELYANHFGLNEEETDYAGSMWTEYQLRDGTPAPLFDGIAAVVRRLRPLPQGIVSQSSRAHIERSLKEAGILDSFAIVVGYEEVHLRRQKPEPDGLLLCLDGLTGYAPGVVVYIGDHETDAECVARGNRALEERGLDTRIISVGAFYGVEPQLDRWKVAPDLRVTRPRDIVRIVRG